MNKTDVSAFFDRLAPSWDANLVRDERKIARILDCGAIGPGMDVLDVACGTGVLIPDYLARDVAHVTGIDLSPAMIARATEKFIDPRVTLVAADVEEASFDRTFDRCMVYNAFPHFPDPARLLSRLAALLSPNGRLTVAHGMGRAAIMAHHAGTAAAVSLALPEATALAALMEPYFLVDTVVSDDGIYIVSGTKRA